MSDVAKTLLITAAVVVFAAVMFWGGSVYGYNKAREQLFISCMLSQHTTPVAAAAHVCSTITGFQ